MATVPALPVRRKLPDERKAITHKFSIAGHEVYVTVGTYEDGTPGEIFIMAAKEGSTIADLMKSFGRAFSLALQYGVPLEVLIEKLSDPRFESSSPEKDYEPPYSTSVVGYVMRWLSEKFLGPAEVHQPDASSQRVSVEPLVPLPAPDPPSCCYCGTVMARKGEIWRCPNCGTTAPCR